MTTPARVVRFWSVGAAGTGVQIGTLAALVYLAGTSYALATVVAVSTAVVHNFLWHRAWTWSDRRATGSTLGTFVRFVTANGLVSIVGNLGVMWVLVGLGGMPAIPASVTAVAACGALNYCLADTAVFRER